MPARILIIEDNQTNLDLMTFLLTSFGHTPLVARDGVEGLEIVHREPLDLIICDMHLPVLDGYEFARKVKNDPTLRPVPLVAVTALAMVGDKDKVMAAGFDGYIAKPIAPRTFVQQVEAFLSPDQCSTFKPPMKLAPSPPPPAPHTTILVVDNSPTNLRLIHSTLEPHGYKVISAGDIRGALRLALQSLPDLILSDIHMSDGNGFDFIQAVKANPQLRPIPFVFITSTTRQEMDWATGMNLGAAQFIFRPIKPQKLLAEIEACLKNKGRGVRKVTGDQ